MKQFSFTEEQWKYWIQLKMKCTQVIIAFLFVALFTISTAVDNQIAPDAQTTEFVRKRSEWIKQQNLK